MTYLKCFLVCILLFLVDPRCTSADRAMTDITFIDQYNLRRIYKGSPEEHRAQVEDAKRSMDVAKKYGATSYMLFSRCFEGLINYDFAVPDLGNLSGKVWPEGSDKRKQFTVWSSYFKEVIDHGSTIGLKVYMHTNQYDFPQPLMDMVGDKLSGTAPVCPAKPLTHDLMVGKFQEFFRNFPKCAGLAVTVSETMTKPTECNCPMCKDLSPALRFKKVADAMVDANKGLGKTMILRTWGKYETPEAIEALPREIICSTKFTVPDFHLINKPNPILGVQGDRQDAEFDAFGEYSGWNFFPCYYGDVFAARIKLCADKGVKRMGIRLNLEPQVNPIFGAPYGNQVNIAVFMKLARNPDGDPDAYLKDYITRTFPKDARDAAFNLYKKSFGWQRIWLTWRGLNVNDHSRVFNGGVRRIRSQCGWIVPSPYSAALTELNERRVDINNAYKEAITAVSALAPHVDAAFVQLCESRAVRRWNDPPAL
ncbi:MAG: hypothetical protein WCL39_05060 [Armatimonadota bacterium]